MPPSVQAVLAARIDRLPAAEKQLLQEAAVIGQDVPANLLHEISGLSDEALLGICSTGCRLPNSSTPRSFFPICNTRSSTH